MASKQPSLVCLAILCSLPWDSTHGSCSTHAQPIRSRNTGQIGCCPLLPTGTTRRRCRLRAVQPSARGRRQRRSGAAGRAAAAMAAGAAACGQQHAKRPEQQPPGLSTAAADGAAPAQPAKLRPGSSVNRGNRGTERPDMQQYPRAAAAHTVKGFTRLVWQSGDLAA